MNIWSVFSVPIHDLKKFNFFNEKMAKFTRKGENQGSNVASAHITCPKLKNFTALMISTEGWKTI
jgi:hypothetical protein